MKRHTLLLIVSLAVGSLLVSGCDSPAEKFASSQAAMFEASSNISTMECECTEDWDEHFIYDSEEECMDDVISDDEISEFESCFVEALEGADEDPPDELADAADCMNEAADALSACEDEVRSEYDDVCEDFDDVQEDLRECRQDVMEQEEECSDEFEDALDEWGDDIEEDADECFADLMGM